MDCRVVFAEEENCTLIVFNVSHRQAPHEPFIDSAFTSVIDIAVAFIHDMPARHCEN